jgi:UDP:flavonoid glycosyltransferase YjiC (YdhE family)
MARIVITSAGTLGDFVPFVALGRRLQTRGHQVRMAVNPAMVAYVTRAGLHSAPCGRAFGSEEARQRTPVFDHWTRLSDEAIRKEWSHLDIEQSYHDLEAACRDATLLIASTLQMAAPMVHEQTGLPWITVSLLPREFPHADAPTRSLQEQDLRLWREYFAYLNQIRARLGFASLSDRQWQDYTYSDRLLLLASSSQFSRPLVEQFPQLRITGFWFDNQPGDWTPSAELLDFLDVEPRPLVLTFSSLPVPDASSVVALHAEVAARLGRRLLIQRGWAQLDRPALADRVVPGRVLWTGSVPHAWLFPQAAAVIHHGGVGTTAQAMRCGCPMLVEPYGNDQFFNARRVLALGVGGAMHPHKLTVVGLTRMLEERVLTPEVRRRALELGARLREEDGLTVASDLIEQQLTSCKQRI